MKKSSSTGLTLLELMIATAVLVIAIGGLLAIFTSFFSLNENNKNTTLAMAAVEDKMEEIRNSPFENIITSYNATSFTPNGFTVSDAKGTIYTTSINSNLLQICVTISWKERFNKITGEDTNLNGVLDSGEDINGDGRLSSPAEIITLMAKR